VVGIGAPETAADTTHGRKAMNNELYTAASGLRVETRRLELITNNLANLSTNGYRAQRAFSTEFRPFANPRGGPTAVAGTYEVPGPGPLRATGNPLDIVLENGTLLTIETASGKRYTRAGNLQVSPDGYLTDARGHRVLDPKGKPLSGLGPDARIVEDSRVLAGETEVGRLGLVKDPERLLLREGNNLFTARGNDASLAPADDATVRAGWLEGSGTNALDELVRLVEAQRAFESYQKLISLTMNDVNKKAVNDIAG
jgi:flagellar basal body rod protein FlgG